MSVTFEVTPETFLAKGTRGVVYLVSWKGKPAVAKRVNPSSIAHETLAKEARFLKIANAMGIGPRLYAVRKDEILMEFIEGELILGFFSKHRAIEIVQVCRTVLEQCRQLDLRGINKKELTNPYKHIIIRKKTRVIRRGRATYEPVMIDFERCHMTQKPKNVTQFLQFLGSGLVRHALCGKVTFDADTLHQLAREYKNNSTERMWQKVLGAIND